jgi:hypothetical protein
LEYKSWKKGSFSLIHRPPPNGFKNQFLNYIKNGDFEYIFDGQKLVKDKVPDPSAFIKGEFQKFFKNNNKEIFRSNPDFFKKFERIDGGKIEDYEDLAELISHDSFQLNHPIFDFIKVE